MDDLISNMKERIKNSGTSRKEIFYVGADSKRRIRFLQELNDGFEFQFHSHWNKGINALCLEEVGGDCPYCAEVDEELKTYTMYAWSVWDADANAVRILLYKATGITPVPAFIEFFEEYGTIMDRDYTIKKIGKGISGNITVIPGEISKFRNSKAKPYTKKQMIKLLEKAFPVNGNEAEDEDEEDLKPKKKKGKDKGKSKKQPQKGKKKKEPTIEEKLAELDEDELKEIALELGISKKELKKLDEEEIVELLVSDYEEEDLTEAYESFQDADEDDDEDEEDGDYDDDEDDDDDD